jgi:hypothetical protein
MKRLTRRSVMAGAAAVAVVPAVGLSGKARAAGEDAALIRLWEEWKAQHIRCRDLYEVEQAIEEKVAAEGGPVWNFAKLDCKAKGEYSALFYSSWSGDNQIKVVSFRAKSYEAADQRASQVSRALLKKRETAREAAGVRCGLPRATKDLRAASNKVRKIEDQIAATEARGLHGLAVKLAIWRQYDDEHSESEDDAVDSAYDALVKMIGVDYAAQAVRW